MTWPNPNEVIIDVSAAQGSIDLHAVAQSLEPLTLVGVIGRVTRGASVTDSTGIQAIIDGWSMGLRYVMAYHFATSEDGQSQSANLLRTIDHYLPTLWGRGCVWIDIENDSVTGLPFNAGEGLRTLLNCEAYHKGQCGYYTDRSIQDDLHAFDARFGLLPPWVAIPDGSVEQQARDRDCVLVQYGQLAVDGTSGNHNVDASLVLDYARLDAMCKITSPQLPKETDMIIFIDKGNAYLWGGGYMVSLGGEPDVLAFLQSKGVFTCETAAGPQFAEFYERCKGSGVVPIMGPGTITGTVTF